MGKIYMECFAGISGDMMLGALVDLGAEPDKIRKELSKLGLDHEFEIIVARKMKHGIEGTKLDVIDHNNAHDHEHHDHKHHDHAHHDHEHHDHEHHDHAHYDHEHYDHKHHDHAHHDHAHHDHEHHDHEHHDHAHHDHGHHDHEHHDHHHDHLRNFRDIKALIIESDLSETVKKNSLKVFGVLAEAEGKIHGKTAEEVHFHEVGAIDSIVDIIGTCIALDLLNITEISTSTVEVGSGFVKCAHGLMPVPAPATAELLKGIPIKSRVKGYEMTTPTGAAILKALASEFTDERSFIVNRIGYGLGTRELDIPNLVRISMLSETPVNHASVNQTRKQFIMETNIDDMSSEQLVFAEELLLSAGALDVYKTAIIMKKGRPAIKLTILAWEEDLKKLQKIVFEQTTSIGMRLYPVEKVKIERAFEVVETEFGPLTLKKAYFDGELVNVKPEYEEIKVFALREGVSIKKIYQEIQKYICYYEK